MPRGRKALPVVERRAAALEQRLKLFRQWIAATREAIAFRDEIDSHRRRARRRAEGRRLRAAFDEEDAEFLNS